MNPLANVALRWNGQVRDEKFKCSPLTFYFLHSTYIYTIMEFVQQDSHIVVNPAAKKKKLFFPTYCWKEKFFFFPFFKKGKKKN